MVFQDPMTSLNPVRRIARQLIEAMTAHCRFTRRASRIRAIDLLRQMGVSAPARVVGSYRTSSAALRYRSETASDEIHGDLISEGFSEDAANQLFKKLHSA